MGCWNETCMLTNLPIHVGHETVCLLIAERPNLTVRHNCYADDIYAPICLPFHGTYNDYGCIEDIKDDKESRQFLAKLPLYEYDEATKQMKPIDLSSLLTENWQDSLFNILDAASEHMIFLESRLDKKQVHCCLIREEFFRFVCDKMGPVSKEEFLHSRNIHPILRDKILYRELSNEAIAPLIQLTDAMNILRISYHPTCGGGSQGSIDYEWQEAFYQKIAETAHELHRYMD